MDIFLLDVGTTKYGDCIVVRQGGQSILIDGAHPGDATLIKNQLAGIFGHAAPFAIDLLVVTHCHQDHIGCLPKLVADGTVTFRRALVADEKLGWGRSVDDDSPLDALPLATRKLLLALQEEPLEDATDQEVRQFIEDAATLESKYRDMLNALSTAGVTVVRYGRDGAAAVAALEAEFSAFEMKVLGPTTDHLVRCAEYISQASQDAVDALRLDGTADNPGDLVSAYRRLVAALTQSGLPGVDSPLEDLPGVGAAKNDQSIVISVGANGKKGLLTGDMQFADAEVPDLDDDMAALRATVAGAGPFDLIKLSHHSSYNGFNLDVWSEQVSSTGKTVLIHTGGLNDAGHPSGSVLTLLKDYPDYVEFARTDRNGRITAKLDSSPIGLTIERGALNNFEKNVPPDSGSLTGSGAAPEVVKEAAKEVVKEAPVADERIRFSIKVPPSATRVTVTVDLDPQKKTD